MKSKTLSSKKKGLFILYNNSLLESWTDDSIQDPITSPTTNSWDVYPISPIAKDSAMAVDL